jgi:hypothetical protein
VTAIAPRVLTTIGLTLALGACATANTPEQNLAYDRWEKCSTPYVELERVEIDGRITFMFTSTGERQAILQCLADAGRNGPSLPEPRGVRPPGGP